MKKWIFLLLGVAVFFAGTQLIAQVKNNGGCYLHGNGYQWMRDSNGNLLDRATVETKLNQAVTDKLITEATKNSVLQNYDQCVANGGGSSRCGYYNGGNRGCGQVRKGCGRCY